MYLIGVSIDSLHTISVGLQTPILLNLFTSFYWYLLMNLASFEADRCVVCKPVDDVREEQGAAG